MADNFLNKTGLQYYHNRAKTIFADKSDIPTDAEIETLAQGVVDDSIADTGTGTIASKGYVDTNGGKIDSISIDGTAQTIDANKNVALDLSDYAKDTDIPTKTSDLTNDSTYQTLAEVTQAIDDAIAGVTEFGYEIVDTLPASGEKGTIYLVEDAENPGSYIEWLWIETAWERIGHTGTVDLTDYWSKTELTAITTAEIDEIVGA